MSSPNLSNPTITQKFAEFAARLTPTDLPRDVIQHAKLCILDSLGIGFAATRYDFADAVIRAARALGGTGASPVIGQAVGLPLRDAILVNGTLIHGLDFDDTHGTSVVHCSASAVPLTFNLGVEVRISGADLLAAYVLAVEIDARIGETARGGLQTRGFHPTGIVGAFGCAAAAAWLKGLSQTQFKDALGITLSMASGNLEFLADGAWTKRLHPGWAGVAGVTAATLAAQDFKGPERPFEGRFGLYNTLLGPAHGIDFTPIGDDLGDSWRTLGTSFKPYPACHFNHAFADCALELKREHAIAIDDIESITAFIHPDEVAVVCEPLIEKRRPKNHYEAQFSVPYIIAASLVRDRFTLSELEPEAREDPDILALAERISYAEDPESAYPKYYSGSIIVNTRDGRRFEHRETVNRGSDANPLSESDILDKYHGNAGLVMSHSGAERLADTVLCIETAPDLTELTQALTGAENATRQQAI